MSFALGENLGAKPSKIVSGQEAQKTNEFLQALAKIVDKKIDTSPHVEKVLKGEKPGKTKPNNKTGGGPYNAKTAANNAKNTKSRDGSKNRDGSKTRDGSTSRKNSLTGSQNSGSNSRSNSKSPAKKVISRQTSKETEQPKQNGSEMVNGDSNGEFYSG